MKRETRTDFQVGSAVGMLAAGVALSVAGFCVAPVGEISDSVLWFFAQCLLYAGSIFGVTAYVQDRVDELGRQTRGPQPGVGDNQRTNNLTDRQFNPRKEEKR